MSFVVCGRAACKSSQIRLLISLDKHEDDSRSSLAICLTELQKPPDRIHRNPESTMHLRLSVLALLVVLVAGVFAQEEEKSLAKRQSYWYYYVCGTYPYQWTSYYPCNNNPQPQPQPNYCSNGGSSLGYTCYSNYQCNSYRNGAVCSNGQCCTGGSSWNPTPSVSPLCGGRETSNGYCSNGMCGGEFLCTSQNVCCRCSSGVSAGPCVNNQCPTGLTCNSVGQCCTVTVG